ncbi:MAG TPA: hydroxyacylglutathione hydrolase [Kofleriaceae bacterium]|jgi:hydroxyacylglutathione hydrolase
MRVVPVPCLQDNYAYLVIDGDRAAVVDPSEAPPVEAALAREGVTLAAIWLTHHHWDHVGGVKELAAARPGLEVIASAVDAKKIEGVTRTVVDGDTVALPGVIAKILTNPGHTLGAISFVTGDSVFTGDTLFGGGCGKVFEGDAAMMYASLMKLAALPPATRVYFGHEYTASNLRFAAAVEPDNAAIAARARELAMPSPGSTVELERATNPFLREANPQVAAAAKREGATGDAPAEIFHALREWKNRFK